MNQWNERISGLSQRRLRFRYIKMMTIITVGFILYCAIIYTLIKLIIYPFTPTQTSLLTPTTTNL